MPRAARTKVSCIPASASRWSPSMPDRNAKTSGARPRMTCSSAFTSPPAAALRRAGSVTAGSLQSGGVRSVYLKMPRVLAVEALRQATERADRVQRVRLTQPPGRCFDRRLEDVHAARRIHEVDAHRLEVVGLRLDEQQR